MRKTFSAYGRKKAKGIELTCKNVDSIKFLNHFFLFTNFLIFLSTNQPPPPNPPSGSVPPTNEACLLALLGIPCLCRLCISDQISLVRDLKEITDQ